MVHCVNASSPQWASERLEQPDIAAAEPPLYHGVHARRVKGEPCPSATPTGPVTDSEGQPVSDAAAGHSPGCCTAPPGSSAPANEADGLPAAAAAAVAAGMPATAAGGCSSHNLSYGCGGSSQCHCSKSTCDEEQVSAQREECGLDLAAVTRCGVESQKDLKSKRIRVLRYELAALPEEPSARFLQHCKILSQTKWTSNSEKGTDMTMSWESTYRPEGAMSLHTDHALPMLSVTSMVDEGHIMVKMHSKFYMRGLMLQYLADRRQAAAQGAPATDSRMDIMWRWLMRCGADADEEAARHAQRPTTYKLPFGRRAQCLLGRTYILRSCIPMNGSNSTSKAVDSLIVLHQLLNILLPQQRQLQLSGDALVAVVNSLYSQDRSGVWRLLLLQQAASMQQRHQQQQQQQQQQDAKRGCGGMATGGVNKVHVRHRRVAAMQAVSNSPAHIHSSTAPCPHGTSNCGIRAACSSNSCSSSGGTHTVGSSTSSSSCTGSEVQPNKRTGEVLGGDDSALPHSRRMFLSLMQSVELFLPAMLWGMSHQPAHTMQLLQQPPGCMQHMIKRSRQQAGDFVVPPAKRHHAAKPEPHTSAAADAAIGQGPACHPAASDSSQPHGKGPQRRSSRLASKQGKASH